MVLGALALLYVSGLALVYGSAAITVLRRLLGTEAEPDLPVSVEGIVGLVVLAVVAGFLSLLVPIGLWANLVVVAGAAVVALLLRPDINGTATRVIEAAKGTHLLSWAVLFLVVAEVLIEVAAVPKVGDSGLYHIQTIRWLESYRAVPGLGNLHGFFAWNSMWFPLQALGSFSFLGIPSLHVANGALYLFAVSFFLGGVVQLLEGRGGAVSLAKAAAVPLSLFVYKPQIGSPATDLPVALLLWVALLLVAERRPLPTALDPRTLVILLLCVFSVTVKLAALPVVLLWTVVLLRLRRGTPTGALAAAAVLVVLVLAPWIGRNVILSGYLIYPIAGVDLFSVDWKLPETYVMSERLATLGWSRLPGPDWEASLEMAPWEWIPRWYAWLPYHYRIVVTATALVGLAAVTWGVLRPAELARAARMSPALLLVQVTAWAGVAYWFIGAPDPRFGFGFLLPALVLPIGALAETRWARFPAVARLAVATIILGYAANHAVLSVASVPEHQSVLLTPAILPSAPLDTVVIDGFTFHLPVETDQCWDAPLPCMPVVNDGLQARGTSLQDGFRIRDD